MSGIVAQIAETVDAAGKLTEGGIVMILLFLLLTIGGGVTILVVSVHRQFFGSSKREGYVPRLVNKHEAFLDRMAAAIERVADSTEENTRTAKNIEVTTKKTDSTINKLMEFMRRSNMDIQSFRKVWKSHVRILMRMADRIGVLPEIEEHLKQMEHILDEQEKGSE